MAGGCGFLFMAAETYGESIGLINSPNEFEPVEWGKFEFTTSNVLGALGNIMTKLRILFFMAFLLIPVTAFAQTSRTSAMANKGEGFQSFYAKFRLAVNRRDSVALRQLMGSRFDWATDGYVSGDQAFQYIGQIIGWKRFWPSARRAVSTKPKKCQYTLINQHSGYCVSARSPAPLNLVFERSSDGNWYWSALPGD
jgi:hypothetical protein